MDESLVDPRVCEDLVHAASEREIFSQSAREVFLYLIYAMVELYRKRLLLEVFVADQSCYISENIIMY